MKKTIEVQCPQCGKKLQVPRWRTGQRGKCSQCEGAVVIPSVYSSMQADLQLMVDVTTESASENALVQEETDAMLFPCPSCGHDNPETSITCEQCNAPLHDIPGGIFCPSCGQKNTADSPNCAYCSHPLSEETKGEIAFPVRKKRRFKLAMAFMIVIIATGVASYGYRDRLFPIWSKYRDKFPSWSAIKNRSTDNSQSTRASHEDASKAEYQKWRTNYEEFVQDQLRIAVKRREFTTVVQELENFAAQPGADKEQVAKLIKEIRSIQNLFALCHVKLSEFQNPNKLLRAILIDGQTLDGRVLRVDQTKKEFVMRVIASNSEKTIAFEKLSIKSLVELTLTKHRKDGNFLYNLAMLYYYEGEMQKCQKYLQEAADLQDKSAQEMLQNLKKEGKIK